jgi:hypothetical protein
MSILNAISHLATATAVFFGCHGAVSERARQAERSRQSLYREADATLERVVGTATERRIHELTEQLQQRDYRIAQLEQRLAQAVLVLDHDKQAEFASVGQAMGVSLPEIRTLLEVLLPGRVASVATLGRRTQAAGEKSAALLKVLDEFTLPRVHQIAADEIHVSQPVLMAVEPASMCWVIGQKTEHVDGPSWDGALGRLPNVEQVTHDGGSGVCTGVAMLNQQRQQQGLRPAADQLDHFHCLRQLHGVVSQAEDTAKQTLTAVDKAHRALVYCKRHGKNQLSSSNRLRAAWPRAIKASEKYEERKQLWQEIKRALEAFTPEGELNTRARAQAILDQTLSRLQGPECATAKRMLQQPQTLTYLDEIQRKLAELPVRAELRAAALQQEGLRRHPELLKGESNRAAAMRGVLLVCAVILHKAGELGQQAVQGVRDILRNTWRANSLVECLNSVLRMQQARHRKMTQGLLDLKRLYWNCHVFRTGRRRRQSPYAWLGVPWPTGLRWWDVLKWSPEQLRQELSAQGVAT